LNLSYFRAALGTYLSFMKDCIKEQHTNPL
jgi:hypothetical protein